MIHHSCDRCQKVINTEEDIRYVVCIEVRASMDGLSDEEIEDRDHLVELEEILDRLECAESDEFSEELYQRQRHDLCSKCYREYIKNPLKKDPKVHFGFSEN